MTNSSHQTLLYNTNIIQDAYNDCKDTVYVPVPSTLAFPSAITPTHEQSIPSSNAYPLLSDNSNGFYAYRITGDRATIYGLEHRLTVQSPSRTYLRSPPQRWPIKPWADAVVTHQDMPLSNNA